jgi:hypothetical protein
VRHSRLLLLLGFGFALACASRRPSSTLRETPLAEEVRGPGLLFRLTYQSIDAAEVQRLRQDLLLAAPRVARWGAFRQGVTIRVYPDHASLEAALDRPGYPWLRAWSLHDEVMLQSPRTWAQGDEREVADLLAHELTHALMFQLMAHGDEWSADANPPPVWFREGMASVTADQGWRLLRSDALARWRAQHPRLDLLNPAPETYRTEKEAVYSAAHYAFAALLRETGDEGVRRILRGVSEGQSFAESFQRSTGRTLASFEHDALTSEISLGGGL